MTLGHGRPRRRSASGVHLADDLFDSSDDDGGDDGERSEWARRQQEQRQGGQGGGGRGRGGGPGAAGQAGAGRGDSDLGARGLVRVDDGVKPLAKTVATVADSILDFFS